MFTGVPTNQYTECLHRGAIDSEASLNSCRGLHYDCGDEVDCSILRSNAMEEQKDMDATR